MSSINLSSPNLFKDALLLIEKLNEKERLQIKLKIEELAQENLKRVVTRVRNKNKKFSTKEIWNDVSGAVNETRTLKHD